MLIIMIRLLWKIFVWLFTAACTVLGLIVTLIGAAAIILVSIILIVKLILKAT
jgi:hypothetical protein